jgi:PKD repeat protein
MNNCEVLAFIEDQATGEIITGVGVHVGESTYIEPTAGFTVEDNTVGVGSTANFTDASSGNPTEWLWTFEGGDPASSTLPEPPAVTYNTAGQYDVTLEVTNPAGSNTMTMTNFVDVGYGPESEFSANQTMILEGEGVTFTDLSSNNPTSWAWHFDGGTPESSTDQNPTEIIYNTPGIYSVSLTTLNDYGEDILLQMDYIHVGGLGIGEETELKSFSVYPNPSNGNIFIESNGKTFAQEVLIRNVSGQVVYSQKADQSIVQNLDLSSLNAGMYFVEIKTADAVYLEKVILK